MDQLTQVDPIVAYCAYLFAIADDLSVYYRARYYSERCVMWKSIYTAIRKCLEALSKQGLTEISAEFIGNIIVRSENSCTTGLNLESKFYAGAFCIIIKNDSSLLFAHNNADALNPIHGYRIFELKGDEFIC